MKVTIRKIICFVLLLAFSADVTVLGAQMDVEPSLISHLHSCEPVVEDGELARQDHKSTQTPGYRRQIFPYHFALYFNFEKIFFEPASQVNDCKFIKEESTPQNGYSCPSHTRLFDIDNTITFYLSIFLLNSSFLC